MLRELSVRKTPNETLHGDWTQTVERIRSDEDRAKTNQEADEIVVNSEIRISVCTRSHVPTNCSRRHLSCANNLPLGFLW